jgi:hypothetical protein
VSAGRDAASVRAILVNVRGDFSGLVAAVRWKDIGFGDERLAASMAMTASLIFSQSYMSSSCALFCDQISLLAGIGRVRTVQYPQPESPNRTFVPDFTPDREFFRSILIRKLQESAK